MKCSRNCFDVIIAFATLLVPAIAGAVDGVILIDQNRALAGNVTPGDAPGFPVTISRSGSYRLSGNLEVTNVTTSVIDIVADDVSIDLNGFSIRGAVTCTGTPVTSCTAVGSASGVNASGGHSNITVHNGTVRGMSGAGVFLFGSGNLVEKVRAENNTFGISITSGTVSHNTVTRNGNSGIFVETGIISHNTASGNREHGIRSESGAVSHNIASGNGGSGLFLGGSAGYTGNVSNNNGGDPIIGGVSLGGGNHNVCNGAAC